MIESTLNTATEAPQAVRERPILFSGDMVNAILEGRKTQTRRVIANHPERFDLVEWKPWFIDGDRQYRGNRVGRGGRNGNGVPLWLAMDREHGIAYEWGCPYGEAGDELWVRESWNAWDTSGRFDWQYWHEIRRELRKESEPDFLINEIMYRASTHELYDLESNDRVHFGIGAHVRPYLVESGADKVPPPRWIPSIHMPRWASRIQLGVRAIRVERIQEISEADIIAEGVASGDRNDFRELWNRINEKRGFGWSVNPLVWVVEFERIES